MITFLSSIFLNIFVIINAFQYLYIFINIFSFIHSPKTLYRVSSIRYEWENFIYFIIIVYFGRKFRFDSNVASAASVVSAAHRAAVACGMWHRERGTRVWGACGIQTAKLLHGKYLYDSICKNMLWVHDYDYDDGIYRTFSYPRISPRLPRSPTWLPPCTLSMFVIRMNE